MIEFEEAFSQFISHSEYHRAENALYLIARLAFRSGWLAAGGCLSEYKEDTCDTLSKSVLKLIPGSPPTPL